MALLRVRQPRVNPAPPGAHLVTRPAPTSDSTQAMWNGTPLSAIGRKPVTDALQLDRAGVKVDGRDRALHRRAAGPRPMRLAAPSRPELLEQRGIREPEAKGVNT